MQDVEYREIGGMVLAQKRNNTLFTAELLKNVVTKACNEMCNAMHDRWTIGAWLEWRASMAKNRFIS